MSAAASSSSPVREYSAPLSQATSVKASEEPLLRIIHLDTDGGGDCTVFIGETSFVVIDGGKRNTGQRLARLMQDLIGVHQKKLVLCVISHFDTDHYQGLITALMELQTLPAETRPQLKVFSPVGIRYLDKKHDQSDEQRRTSTAGTVIKQLRDAHPSASFGDPATFTFDGWTMKFLGGGLDMDPLAVGVNNGSSSMWRFRHAGTPTSYYTGGDSVSGPCPATIIKLDHHGSAAENCNANLRNCAGAKAAIVMGPGAGHQHPARSVMDQLNVLKIPMFTTHYHFDDWKQDKPSGATSRAGKCWGDIGISIYKGEKFVIDMGGKAGKTLFETAMPVDDALLASCLQTTRNLAPNPASRALCERGAAQAVERTCAMENSDCAGAIVKVESLGSDFGGGYVCGYHKSEFDAELTQRHCVAKAKIRAENKRQREKEDKRFDDDEEFVPEESHEEKKPKKSKRQVKQSDDEDQQPQAAAAAAVSAPIRSRRASATESFDMEE